MKPELEHRHAQAQPLRGKRFCRQLMQEIYYSGCALDGRSLVKPVAPAGMVKKKIGDDWKT
jgi:hypothetical protein